MEDYKFPHTKVLILENGFWDDNERSGIYPFYRTLASQGVEFKIIDQASRKEKSEIITGLAWCEVLLFSSTFIYEHEVKGLGDLLGSSYFKDSPKTVIGYCCGNRGDLKFYLEKIWEVKELAKMGHHDVYELVNTHVDLGEPLQSIDMSVYKNQFDKDEEERVNMNHSMPKTGRKVRIKKINASGIQWSLLNENDEVDELDCSSIDPNPKRGIWVMGKDEPVKLLNDGGYEEWEFAELTAEGLTIEFFARGCKLDQELTMETLETWIYNCAGKADSSELWHWCDNICKLTGVERRGNRSYFERRLKEYAEKHKFFKESDSDPRLKLIYSK